MIQFLMKNLFTYLSIALCLGAFSFTYLKEAKDDQKMIHTVFFWLDENLSETEIAEFENALVELGTVPTIDQFSWGPPAPTENRDVVDSSYSYAISVHFSSLKAQKTYQDHPIHLKFLKQAPKWGKVIVYDNEVR